MKGSKNQNPIQVLTTVSVFVGLVLVGASSTAFAQSPDSRHHPSRYFEFSTSASGVFSKLSLRKKTDDEEVFAFAYLLGSVSSGVDRVDLSSIVNDPASYSPPSTENDQVFTVALFPRSSI